MACWCDSEMERKATATKPAELAVPHIINEDLHLVQSSIRVGEQKNHKIDRFNTYNLLLRTLPSRPVWDEMNILSAVGPLGRINLFALVESHSIKEAKEHYISSCPAVSWVGLDLPTDLKLPGYPQLCPSLGFKISRTDHHGCERRN